MYEDSIPTKYKNIGKIKDAWITYGIGISCNHKRYLHMHSRNSSDPHTAN
jgi:hypothetical protein